MTGVSETFHQRSPTPSKACAGPVRCLRVGVTKPNEARDEAAGAGGAARAALPRGPFSSPATWDLIEPRVPVRQSAAWSLILLENSLFTFFFEDDLKKLVRKMT